MSDYKLRIETEWADDDGYWIELKSGWQDSFNPTCHTIREDTKIEAHKVAAGINPLSLPELLERCGLTSYLRWREYEIQIGNIAG
jgi:hypothetical protein